MDATGVGSAVPSCSNDVAEADCEAAGEGGADRSSDRVSVSPGVVATRATNSARALELPVVDSEDEAAVEEEAGAAGSGRDSGVVPAFDAGADFAQRPEVDVAPAAEVGACEGAVPEGVGTPRDIGAADELPGLAGRGGAFAAGGGDAGGAGRAGGTVGMADRGAILGGVAVRADVAEVALGKVAAAGVEAAAPDADVLEVGVPDAAGAEPAADPRAAPVAEGVGVAPVFADGAAVRGAPPAWVVCEDVGFDAAVDLFEGGGVASDAPAVTDLRVAVAATDESDAGAEAVVDVACEGAGEPEVGVAGAADRVGGIGASPEPRSAASSIGDAQVPEYALSVDVDAHDPDDVEAAPELPAIAESDSCVTGAVESADVEPEAFATVGLAACTDGAVGLVGIPNPTGDFCVSAAVDALAEGLWDRVSAGAADPVP